MRYPLGLYRVAGAGGGVGADLDFFDRPPSWTAWRGAQLIATGYYPLGPARRNAREVRSWTSSDPAIVTVWPGGRIEARRDGQTERVRIGASEVKTVILVLNAGKSRPIQLYTKSCPP
jgi:hypothetical protein